MNQATPFNLCDRVLNAVNVGTIVLDDNCNIVIWNHWMERNSSILAQDAMGKKLIDLFPELQTGRLQSAIQSALTSRFPSVLSQTLNKSPFPLFITPKDARDGQRMQQAIQVIPITAHNAPCHCLIQVTDVSMAVNRETVLRQQAIELRSKTYTNGLTGIPNRRRFDEHAEEVLRLAKRNCSPLSVVMIDIDFFKQFNDRYGHLTGDQCLIDVAQAISKIPVRPLDMVARWGGEEFIALLPDTALDGAKKIAEDMLAAVNKLGIAHSLSLTAEHVSISLGVATCLSAKRVNHLSDIVRVADMALYEAKNSGRMRVACRTIDLDATT